MPSTSTVRGVIVSRSINQLPQPERSETWKLWWKIDDFHIAKTGASWAGIIAFFAVHVVYGFLFAEVTERGIAIPFWLLCASLATSVAVWLALRVWHYDPKVERQIAGLRREIYASLEQQNAFRFLCRTDSTRNLMPKNVLQACE